MGNWEKELVIVIMYGESSSSARRDPTGEEPWRLAGPGFNDKPHLLGAVVRVPRDYAAHPVGPALLVVRKGAIASGIVFREALPNQRGKAVQLTYQETVPDTLIWKSTAVDLRRAAEGIPYESATREEPPQPEEEPTRWCVACNRVHPKFG